MIYDKDDFEIKYWGGDYVAFNEDFHTEKESRKNVKKNLLIIFGFIFITAFTSLTLFGISNINFESKKNLAVADTEIQKRTVNQDSIDYKNQPSTETKSQIQSIEVINNDSYWKVTKRACGTGQKYLLTRDLNGGKALHVGDFVTVDCSL